ncbi:ABC transporter permease [Clostridium senegalense]|uniref:ABC transporter permease n=1 Tax=Clostridium senegalense TaxID=1465809 RepID=UPI001C1201F1|nr:ABC transporter permease [Clostridium senegalense]MBU5228158.1 ABC transporter permease [Clostridium senegalense]
MKLNVLIFSALRNLVRNKKKSFLTMLGIIIGIAAVITIVALGEGYKNKTIKDLTGENEGEIVLNAMIMSKDNNSSTNTVENNFNNNDKKAIEELSEVKAVEYEYSNNEKGEFVNLTVIGVQLQGLVSKVKSTDSDKIIGRNLTDKDDENATRTIVLTENFLKDKVKNPKNPKDLIGSIASLKGITFEIVGIIEADDEDEFSFKFTSDIQIPESTYNKYFATGGTIQGLKITLCSGVDVKETVKKVQNILNDVGSKKADGEYMVMDTSGIIKIMGIVLNTLTVFIAGVAGISLFIAGIGVMNMVYTSVSERTLEIGIKRSIGARRRDIKREFLVEGIVITVTGGLIGYVVGIIVANIISLFMDITIIPSLFTAFIAIGISIFVGIVSSVIPANKAASSNTIDILK